MSSQAPSERGTPRLKLFTLLWAMGVVGVISMVILLLPQILEGEQLPMPMWLLMLLSILQSSVLLAVACWIGVTLSARVNLRAPVAEAIINREGIWGPLKPQIAPACLVGLGAGIFLAWINLSGPEQWVGIQEEYYPPIIARVLYGGVTEELLLRWGLMTLLVWSVWRIAQRGSGHPNMPCVASAIFFSALLFGAAHLPAVATVAGELTLSLAYFVVGANTLFGILFGFLFWRFGLESAMLGHGIAHIVNHIVVT